MELDAVPLIQTLGDVDKSKRKCGISEVETKTAKKKRKKSALMNEKEKKKKKSLNAKCVFYVCKQKATQLRYASWSSGTQKCCTKKSRRPNREMQLGK